MFKNLRIIIAICAITIIAVTTILLLTVSRVNFSTLNWEIYEFPDENFAGAFFECNDSPYNPEYASIDAQLMNNKWMKNDLYCSEYFKLVKQVGNQWKIVPFTDRTGFADIMNVVEPGMSHMYTVYQRMLSIRLNDGLYRIVTDIGFDNDAGTRETHTVWAEFEIDKNAPKPQYFSSPSDCLGNFEGKEMTLDDLRKIVQALPDISLKELTQEYKCVNLSSYHGSYNLTFSTNAGAFRVRADCDYVISHMTFKIKEADIALDLLKEPEHLDD